MFMSEISSETGSLEATTLAEKQLRENWLANLFRAVDIIISAHNPSTLSVKTHTNFST